MKLNLLLLIPCFYAVVSCAPKQPAGESPAVALLTTAHCRQTIADFSKAVQAKDTALLAQSVSPDFSLAIASWPTSAFYLQHILNQLSIDSIAPAADSVTAMRGSSFKQQTNAVVYINGKPPINTNIVFDGRNGKILYVDYFDRVSGFDRNKSAQLKAVIPIEQAAGDNSIIVALKLNNYEKTLRFLFDTGADGIAISSELAEKAGIKARFSQNASAVGGNAQVNISQGNTVRLDSVQLRNQNIAIFEKVRDNIDGIIGLNIAKSYIVRVDFDEKKMYLYDFGAYTYPAEGETETITVPKGLIIIPGTLNLTGEKAVDGRFVFDTGADYYFMGYAPFVRSNRLLLGGFKPEGQSATVSMGISTPVFEGKAASFGFGAIQQTDMPVSLQGSSPGNSDWKPQADASIGIQLISRYNFTINLLEKEIHFSPRLQ